MYNRSVSSPFGLILSALLVSALLASAGCHKTAVAPDQAEQPLDISVETPAPIPLPQQPSGPFTLGPDDVLLVAVWGREDLYKEGPIDLDGAFFFPLAGRVPAAGLSVVELQADLTRRLAIYIRDPQVDVQLKEHRSRKFFVLGQVRTPGVFASRGDTSLAEALSLAGGLTDEADLAEAFLVRGESVIPIDFLALFQRGDLSQNVVLQRGDVVFVPSSATRRVYVLGEVNTPKVVVMRHERLNLAEAIAEAGGFNEQYAYKSGVQVVRGGLAQPTVYNINFRDVLRGRELDLFELEPGDIVFVPATGLTKWERAMEQLLPNLSRILVDAAAAQSLGQ